MSGEAFRGSLLRELSIFASSGTIVCPYDLVIPSHCHMYVHYECITDKAVRNPYRDLLSESLQGFTKGNPYMDLLWDFIVGFLTGIY